MESQSKLYLIEDDPAVRDALIIFLETCGYSVDAFESSEAFLANAHATGHGVLILDVRLPGMSGIELQTELRKRTFDIPVIFITGHGDEEIRAAVTRGGITDFLSKPVDHDALLKCIEANMARAQGQGS